MREYREDLKVMLHNRPLDLRNHNFEQYSHTKCTNMHVTYFGIQNQAENMVFGFHERSSLWIAKFSYENASKLCSAIVETLTEVILAMT